MTHLVFQHWDGDSGVFVRLEDWEHLTTITAAIEASDTWGQFRQALPPGEFEKLSTWLDNGGEFAYRVGDELLFMSDLDETEFVRDYGEDHVIAQNDAFDLTHLGDSEGAYPEWVGATLVLELPTAFVEAFGHPVGVIAQFPIERTDEMIEHLRRDGFSVAVAELPD